MSNVIVCLFTFHDFCSLNDQTKPASLSASVYVILTSVKPRNEMVNLEMKV